MSKCRQRVDIKIKKESWSWLFTSYIWVVVGCVLGAQLGQRPEHVQDDHQPQFNNPANLTPFSSIRTYRVHQKTPLQEQLNQLLKRRFIVHLGYKKARNVLLHVNSIYDFDATKKSIHYVRTFEKTWTSSPYLNFTTFFTTNILLFCGVPSM